MSRSESSPNASPIPCPLCGSRKSALFDQRSFRDIPVTNRLCQDCGLVYQSPRMSEAQLNAFYESEYRQLYQGSQGPDRKDLAVQEGRAAALLEFTRPYIKEIKRHLDIGCSAGLLLQSFRGAFACQSVGIEPGTAYRDYARQLGLQVYASLDELHAAQEAPFDLVSLAHVLEHLPDPVDYLHRLRTDLLAKHGRLLLEVPNLYAHDSFEVAHLVSYSEHSLQQVLRKAGFETLALQAHGRPRSHLIPLYLTAIAIPAEPQDGYHLEPEKRVVWKRRAGMLRRWLLTRLQPDRAWIPAEKAAAGAGERSA